MPADEAVDLIFRFTLLKRRSTFRLSQCADLIADRTVHSNTLITAGKVEQRRCQVRQHGQRTFLDGPVQPDAGQPIDVGPGRQDHIPRVAQQEQMRIGCHLGRLVHPIEQIAAPVGLLKLGFDEKALLRPIRHNYLYHYPNDKNVERAFEAIPDDEPWEWYFSQANTNSFYFSSELVLGYGLMRATGEPTALGAFGVVMAEAMEIANPMPDFLMRLIEAIMVRHLGPDIFKPQPGLTIADAPALDKFWVPFFAETTS
jgi:hypothetical protein